MTDFHRIITSAPINAQAARQMGRGVEWIPQKQFADAMHIAPPAMQQELYFRQSAIDPHWKDFRGEKIGRLTVIGVTLAKYSDKKHRWVCRCACGFYVERKTRAIDQKLNDRCGQCHYVRYLRDGANDRAGLNT